MSGHCGPASIGPGHRKVLAAVAYQGEQQRLAEPKDAKARPPGAPSTIRGSPKTAPLEGDERVVDP